jgi:hypothetical protein
VLIPLTNRTRASQAFATAFEERFGRLPGLYSAEVYDGAKMLIDAIRRGAGTRGAVLKNLKAGRVQGVTKTFSFQPDGEVGAGSVYVYESGTGRSCRWARPPTWPDDGHQRGAEGCPTMGAALPFRRPTAGRRPRPSGPHEEGGCNGQLFLQLDHHHLQ